MSIWLGIDHLTAATDQRTLSIFNIHTKETVSATFKRGAKYDRDGLAKLNHQLRDWRVDRVTEIDPELFDLLWELHSDLGSKEPIHLISGHRSAETNNMLRRTRGGQAKRSLHITGQAADVYFPDVPLSRLRNAALVRQVGGVGYYPRSGQPFVHVDTGRVRHWPRIPEQQLAQIMKGAPSRPASDRPARVREVQIASADSQETVAGPRFKPRRKSTDRVPQPVRIASAARPDGASPVAPQGQSRGLGKADAIVTPGRSWGQSMLLPTGATAPAHRDDLTPLETSGSSRIIVAEATAAHAVPGSPPPARVYAGYASPAADKEKDQIAGLLSSAADGLKTLIEEADRIQSEAVSPNHQAIGSPTDLRPSVLSTNLGVADDPRQRLATVPIMTASLGTAATERLPLRRRITDAAPGPTESTTIAMPPMAIDAGPELIGRLLHDPVSRHEVRFAGAAPLAVSVGEFTTQDGRRFGETAAGAGQDFVSGLIDAAENALSWFLGG